MKKTWFTLLCALLLLIQAPTLTQAASKKLTPQEILKKYASSVVRLEYYNAYGEYLYYSSALNLSTTGQLVSVARNIIDVDHVASVRVFLADGRSGETETIEAYDEDLELYGFTLSEVKNLPRVVINPKVTVKNKEKLYVVQRNKDAKAVVKTVTVTNNYVNSQDGFFYLTSYNYTKDKDPIEFGNPVYNQYGQFVGMTTYQNDVLHIIPGKEIQKLKFNKDYTIAELNEANYPTNKGEGTLAEEEYRKDPANSKVQYYAYEKGTFTGTLTNNTDTDGFYFYATRYAELEVKAKLSSAFADDAHIEIYDV
ncbi:MAG: hypothetical protein ACRC5C_14580, partial [Bacilli bacterium]